MPVPALCVFSIPGLPLIEPGTDLAAMIEAAVLEAGLQPEDGDVFALAQKIVSKAEDRIIHLRDVEPSDQAKDLARSTAKDPRLVELILRESRRVVRHSRNVIIVEHRLGLVLANAGIDRSNVAGDEDTVLLLPQDPDASAQRLKEQLDTRFGVRLGILITDSIGRPWRLGTTGVAIGCAGLISLHDLRGQLDMFGRVLQVAEVATADCAAGAAGLVMGEGAETIPVVLIRGLDAGDSTQNAATIVRPMEEDLFR
jgi:coenzyme F420-0:L-glutamate ligase/coenzyme F420-1:gamma-L-glutamate ligase